MVEKTCSVLKTQTNTGHFRPVYISCHIIGQTAFIHFLFPVSLFPCKGKNLHKVVQMFNNIIHYLCTMYSCILCIVVLYKVNKYVASSTMVMKPLKHLKTI